MEIQKIFTSLKGEERIYSVLMSEDEFYEVQKEFNLRGGFRKFKRGIKLIGDEMSLMKPIMTDGNLTARQTHALARNQRLALLKNQTVHQYKPITGELIEGKARDILDPRQIDRFRKAERIGKGMISTKSGYVPRT